jgi:hypothetical protein
VYVGVGYIVEFVESIGEIFLEHLLALTFVIEVVLTDKKCVGGGFGFVYP